MYLVGDKIVHPMHGAGVIDGIVEQRVNGVTRQYYQLKMPYGSILVLIPTVSSSDIGVRPVIDSMEADKLLEHMPELETEETLNWNRRYRENMLRIKSGDITEVARVIKCLCLRDRIKGLSTGERKMLNTAKQILISELVLAKSISYEQAEQQLLASFA